MKKKVLLKTLASLFFAAALLFVSCPDDGSNDNNGGNGNGNENGNTIDPNKEYAVTVTGGTADITTAKYGDTITLTEGTQEGKVFSDWTITPAAGVMAAAGMMTFRMPPSDVTVTGNFADANTGKAPYHITNNIAQDASQGFLVQWHHDSSVTAQALQVVAASGSFAGAQNITATPKSFSGSRTGTPPIGDFEARNVFKAEVSGLTPATMYKYRMGEEGAWSKTFYYTTSGGSHTDFSFTVVTDPQAATFEAMSATLKAANEFDSNNRFFLMCGDIVNQIGDRPAEIVNYTNAANDVNITTPIAATQGNHDTYYVINADYSSDTYIFGEAAVFNNFVTFPNNGWDDHADKANRSQSYYFYYNKVLVIMLNTMATGNDTGRAEPNHTKQAAWLREILEHDKVNSLSKYIIVGTHVSPFGGRSSERWLQPGVRQAYGKICTDYGVDIFFAGHDHVYARSNPIKLPTVTTLSNINFSAISGGTIFSIASATGPKFYAVDTSDIWVPKYYPHRKGVGTDSSSNQAPGIFVNVKVTAEKLIVAARQLGLDMPVDAYEVPVKR